MRQKKPAVGKSSEEGSMWNPWIIAGWVFLALAFVGVVLPIVPQVPFAFAAAFCFSRGSKRLHEWLLRNKHFGPAIRAWEEDRVLRPKMKAISTVMMIGGAALAFLKFREDQPIVAVVVPVLFLAAIVYVLTRRSIRPRDLPPLPSEFANRSG